MSGHTHALYMVTFHWALWNPPIFTVFQ